MLKRMTKEEVATLELPEGVAFTNDGNAWTSHCTHPWASLEHVLSMLALKVVNGLIPLSVWEWAMCAYKGKEVPSVEQWEAKSKLLEDLGGQLKAESDWRQQFAGEPPTPEKWDAAKRVSRMVYALPGSELDGLLKLILQPPLPEIAECPRCGGSCSLKSGRDHLIECDVCNWRGQLKPSKFAAIAAHNAEADKLAPKAKRTCGGCLNWSDDAQYCVARNCGDVTPNMTRMHRTSASPTRDASECERWEERP